MDTENSQEQTQNPKYKVGDVVWALLPSKYRDEKGMLIEHAKITALVYSRSDGATTFRGMYFPPTPNLAQSKRLAYLQLARTQKLFLTSSKPK